MICFCENICEFIKTVNMQFNRDKHILQKSNYFSKYVAVANTKKIHFASAKGEFQILTHICTMHSKYGER